MATTVQPGVYRHYKGQKYNVIGEVTHHETMETLVVYEGDSGHLWARPKEKFVEMVEYEGKMVPRFEYMGDGYDGGTLDGWGYASARQEE